MNLRRINKKKGETKLPSDDDPKSLYQPNSTKFIFDTIFATFSTNNIRISQAELRGCPRSYHSYWATLFSAAAETREYFGRLPNRAQVEHEDKEKR